MAVLNRARAPRALKGVVGVPRGRLHQGSIPPTGKQDLARHGIMLRSKRTRRRPRQPGGAAHPPSSWGWSALVDRPEDVDDRRAPGALGG